MREICQFDLTCPIKGVGPGVVRKLLLEESLKIRGRKDSKVGNNPALGPGTFQPFSFSSECLTFSSVLSPGGAMQLEVVALLFSDVLLMTKFQKKGERLKVVRPPLALDRTCCVVLKDGCESGCRAPPGERPEPFLIPPFPRRFVCSCGGGGASERHERLHFCSQQLRELFHLGLDHPTGKGNDRDRNNFPLFAAAPQHLYSDFCGMERVC